MIKFIDIPGIAEFEQLCELHDNEQMMKDELDAFPHQLDEISIQHFGVTFKETFYLWLPEDIRPEDPSDWERHFDFLEWEYTEEQPFWEAVGVDITGHNGEDLACKYYLGRQMVCAIKGLLPNAKPTFLTGEQSDEQLMAAAEQWGKGLGAPKPVR